MRSDSDINLATLLLVALLAAICALNPAETYRALKGLAGGAGHTVTHLFH